MKFIVDDWKQAPKWASMWATGALGSWLAVPDDTKAQLLSAVGVPPEIVTPILLASIVLGRIWKQ